MWVEESPPAAKWLSGHLARGRNAAAGYRESALAVALFDALRGQKTDLCLESVPGGIGESEASAKFGQSLLAPGASPVWTWSALRR